MKFKVKNINLNIYYKYLSFLICDRSSGIFEKLGPAPLQKSDFNL